MLSTRAWFSFRVWRTGERIYGDRAARQREGFWAPVVEHLFHLLLAAVVLCFCFRGSSLRVFAFAAPPWLRWTGVGLGIGSVGLFAWTHVILGRLWSPFLQLRPGH